MKYRTFGIAAMAALMGFSSAGYPQSLQQASGIAPYVGTWNVQFTWVGNSAVGSWRSTETGMCQHQVGSGPWLAPVPCQVDAAGVLAYETKNSKGSPMTVRLVNQNGIISGTSKVDGVDMVLKDFKRQ